RLTYIIGEFEKLKTNIHAFHSKRTTFNVRLQSSQLRVATGKGRRQAGDDEIRLSHARFCCHRRTDCGGMPTSRHRSGIRERGGARPSVWPPAAEHAVR